MVRVLDLDFYGACSRSRFLWFEHFLNRPWVHIPTTEEFLFEGAQGSAHNSLEKSFSKNLIKKKSVTGFCCREKKSVEILLPIGKMLSTWVGRFFPNMLLRWHGLG
jgi:hypothetical protein